MPINLAVLRRSCLVGLLTLYAPTLQAQNQLERRPAPEPRESTPRVIPPRSERVCQHLVQQFENAGVWPLQAMVLLDLGPHWHPAALPMVLHGLGDENLLPFAAETLARTERTVLLSLLADKDFVTALTKAVRVRQPWTRTRLLDVLKLVAGPDAGIEDRRDFDRWLRDRERAGELPPAWPEPESEAEEAQSGNRTTTVPVVERGLDLRDAGLDLVIVIDSTGSMQQAIRDSRDALDKVLDVLEEIAPQLRVGLVTYRDFGDMKDGAKLVVPLQKKASKTRNALDKLRANGGGDVPERVEKGIEVALNRATRWNLEANKLLIVVGDAPPHPETETALLRMVTSAYSDPRGLGRSEGPTTGDKKKLRPFVFSAVSTHKQADRPFKEIAAAGHGTFAALHGQGGDDAPRRLATHLLADAFGASHRDRVDDLLKVWFAARESEQKR